MRAEEAGSVKFAPFDSTPFWISLQNSRKARSCRDDCRKAISLKERPD